jgi:hypothetical protein
VQDAAIILSRHTQNTTGRFRFLFVAIQDGRIQPLIGQMIGDRDVIYDIRIVDGKIEVDLRPGVGSTVEPGQDPQQIFTKVYRFTSDAKIVRETSPSR